MRVYDRLLLELARTTGEILMLVPITDCVVTGTLVRGGINIGHVRWPKGPHGHRVVGVDTTACHVVVELPKRWRERGKAITELFFLEPSPAPKRVQSRGRR